MLLPRTQFDIPTPTFANELSASANQTRSVPTHCNATRSRRTESGALCVLRFKRCATAVVNIPVIGADELPAFPYMHNSVSNVFGHFHIVGDMMSTLWFACAIYNTPHIVSGSRAVKEIACTIRY